MVNLLYKFRGYANYRPYSFSLLERHTAIPLYGLYLLSKFRGYANYRPCSLSLLERHTAIPLYGLYLLYKFRGYANYRPYSLFLLDRHTAVPLQRFKMCGGFTRSDVGLRRDIANVGRLDFPGRYQTQANITLPDGQRL